MNYKIPCKTCITKAACKHKPLIRCSLLLETYTTIKEHQKTYGRCHDFHTSRRLEKLLSEIFKWNYDLTYVDKRPDFIEVVTPAIND